MSFHPLVSRRSRWPWPLVAALKGAVLPSVLILCPAMAAYAADPDANAVNANAVEPRSTRTETVAQLIASARMWRNKSRSDLAVQMIDKALLLSPDNPDALAELGIIKIRSNQLDEASHLLFRLRASNPKSEAARELGYAYMAATTGKQALAELFPLSRKNEAGAIEAVRRLQLLFPDGPPKGDLAADYYTILGADLRRRPEAILALRHLLAEQPDNFSAALTLAGLLGAESATRMEGAKLAQRTVLNPDADRSAALNAWRRILRNAGPDPAYIDLQKAYLQLAPDDGEFKSLLAASQAALAAREKLEADPAWQMQQRGLKILAKNELTPAELTQADALLMKAFASRRTDPELLGGLGRLRADQGRQLEARDFFLEAARLDPANRIGWENQARTASFWGQISAGNSAIDQGHPAAAESAARSALALQPANPYARQLLAEAWMAQRRFGEAEPILRQLLDNPELALSALRNLITVLRETKRPLEIEALMDAMQSRFKGPDQIAFIDLRANQLSDEANPFLEQGKNGPAIEKLEQSIRLAPDQAWIRFKLARLYQRLGLPQLGTEVMEQGLVASKAPEMYYATTLYRNSIDDLPGAVAALNQIPEAQRSDSMRSLANNLRAQQLLLQARQQSARGEQAASGQSLMAAAALAPDDADMLASLGRQWIAAGHPDQGLQLVQNWLTAHPDDPAPDVRLRYGDLLGNAGREAALTPWLEQIRRLPNLTPQQSARLEDQSLRQALRLSDAAAAIGDNAKAEAILSAVNPAGKADKRWSLALADLRRSQGRYAEARQAVAPVLAKTPSDFDARLTLARIEEDSKQPDQALALVRQIVQEAPPEDLDTRLSTARRLTALQHPLEASDVVSALKVQFPNDPDVTLQHGRILQSVGLYADAKSSYELALAQEPTANVLAGTYGTPAQVALFNLEQRGQPLIETAFIPAYKSGTAGVSSLKGQTVPLYVRIPQGCRHSPARCRRTQSGQSRGLLQ
jgi:Flp pilus assembly protein TadD